ncbi:MAG TPA: AAA domain-containing protein, partial [Candidatus Limnocylindrales bacterium]
RLAPAGVDDGTEAGHARWLLAQLLWFHRREDKSFWRRYYELMGDMTDEERVAAKEPLAGLVYEGPVGTIRRSEIHRYSFAPQDFDVRVGKDVRDPATGESPGTVHAIDESARTVELTRAIGRSVPHPTALVPFDFVDPKPLVESLLRIGDAVAAAGIEGRGPYRAARDLLLRRPPRAGRAADGTLQPPDEAAADTAVRCALGLDDSYLAIQGPPGSGKTYAGARIAVALAAAGKRVGITANSHKVIGHLLDEIAACAGPAGVSIGQKPDRGGNCTSRQARCLEGTADVLAAFDDESVRVVGGTAWLWSAEEMAGSVDVLIVDEAGQMSLANTLAVSQAASSIVLLGDPQQLDQPLKGSHPPGADRSALAHLLGQAATVPPDLGLFMEHTRRLHPDVCRFTSEAFYEGKLESLPGCELQQVAGTGPLHGTGLRWIAVSHDGDTSDSPAEAAAVRELVEQLLEAGATWSRADRSVRRIGLEDILVITPYNAQVGELEAVLPGARVGTVDKFQGQEGPISIYSMATSSAADAPRGMEFLYSLHRLNVATSRAKCIAVVVASPGLLRVRARTPRQVRLANALARLVELGEAGIATR